MLNGLFELEFLKKSTVPCYICFTLTFAGKLIESGEEERNSSVPTTLTVACWQIQTRSVTYRSRVLVNLRALAGFVTLDYGCVIVT